MNTHDAEALQELLDALPNLKRGRVTITVVFPGEYFISYEDGKVHFLPGSGTYGSIESGCRRALANLHGIEFDDDDRRMSDD